MDCPSDDVRGHLRRQSIITYWIGTNRWTSTTWMPADSKTEIYYYVMMVCPVYLYYGVNQKMIDGQYLGLDTGVGVAKLTSNGFELSLLIARRGPRV